MDSWSSFLLMTLPARHKSFNLSVSWDHFLSNHTGCLVCLGCKIIPNIFVLMTYTNFRKAPPTTTISSYFWGEMEIFFSGFCKEIEEAMFVCVSVYAFVCAPESVTVWMERQWHTLAERTGWHEYESWKTQTKKKKSQVHRDNPSLKSWIKSHWCKSESEYQGSHQCKFIWV